MIICLEPKCDMINCTNGGGEKILDQRWRCRCTSDSLLAYRPKTVNCTVKILRIHSSAFRNMESAANTENRVSPTNQFLSVLSCITFPGFRGLIKIFVGLLKTWHRPVARPPPTQENNDARNTFIHPST